MHPHLSLFNRFRRAIAPRAIALWAMLGLSLSAYAAMASAILPGLTEDGRLVHDFPMVERLEFRILRNGDKVGEQIMQFHREGDKLIVDIDTDIAINALFVTLYRFQQESQETWQNGQFQSYRALTNDDGKRRDVAIQRAEDGALHVVYNGESSRYVAEAVPGSLWNLLTIRQPHIFDPAKGKLRAIEITDLGKEKVVIEGETRLLHHYRLKGEFERELWYDETGLIFRASLAAKDGSIVMITRRTPQRS